MSMRSLSVAIARLGLALALFTALAPLSSNNAAADGFGAKSPGTATAKDSGKETDKKFSDEQIKALKEARKWAQEQAEKAEAQAPRSPEDIRKAKAAEEASARLRARVLRGRGAKVISAAPSSEKGTAAPVPGCAPGTLCTVCLAGCGGGATNVVVSKASGKSAVRN